MASPVLASAEHRISLQLDACRVRVLLFPLTEISEKRLRFYTKVITECHAEIHTSSNNRYVAILLIFVFRFNFKKRK